MPFKYAYILPVLQGLVYLVCFTTTYVLAVVVNKDVPPIFPYISDTGVWSIEKCVFSFLLGFGALLMVAILYIRYRQVKEILEINKEREFKPILKTINKICLYLTYISGLGLFVVTCFQVQPFLIPHLIGAVCAFTFGCLTLDLQTYISFKIYPVLGNRRLNIFRAIIAVIITVTLIMCGAFGTVSLMYFKGDDITQWTESSGGYQFHLISVANEWILAVGVVIYLTLYTGEFKTVVLYKPNLEIINA